LAQEKALREKNQHASQGKNTGKPVKDIEETKESKGMSVEQTPVPGLFDGQEFNRLKGQLRLPVKGELIARFGTKRGDGPSWKGLFIKANEGAEVKAIAAGKVVFAEWLRGFGNMIILDHGGQYLSLYSNAQAVLKHAGDIVKAGDTIANAGNSGGNEETGLYFEMRYKGQVFDPMSWVRK
jgi:septal ring factor EnvC (AmiA/AmiB activator)